MRSYSLKFTTYQAGLLQARAYRNLKRSLSSQLKPFNLSMLDWATLGAIYDANGKDLRLTDLAQRVSVRPPLITVLVKELKKAGLVSFKLDPDDSRAKLVAITDKGQAMVIGVEKHLRLAMKQLLKGVNRLELIGYLSVLGKLANGKD